MPIKNREAPAGAINALRDGLQHAMGNNAPAARALAAPPAMMMARASPGAPRTVENEAAAPHPVYTVDPLAIADGVLLEAAVPTGWRYLILQGDDAVAAGTVVESHGKLEFSALNEGRLVGLTVESLTAAEAAFEDEHKDFELRYLEIRPLHFSAVWLHSEDEDFILPLEDSQDADIAAHSLQPESTILEMLQAEQAIGSTFPELPEEDR